MKYKQGDRVRLRKDLARKVRYDGYWAADFIAHKGKVVTISAVFSEWYETKEVSPSGNALTDAMIARPTLFTWIRRLFANDKD